jgi:hypothetical protein
MKPMPDSIQAHISNARYYLDAANKHPAPTQDAVHILLQLIAWENIVIADEELSAWATEDDVDERLYKSHATKYKAVPEVLRVILGPSGTPPREIRYSSGRNFEELRMACQYGSNTEGKEVKELFKKGWHLDELRNGLIGKIEWVELFIKIHQEQTEN